MNNFALASSMLSTTLLASLVITLNGICIAISEWYHKFYDRLHSYFTSLYGIHFIYGIMVAMFHVCTCTGVGMQLDKRQVVMYNYLNRIGTRKNLEFGRLL